MAGDREQDGLRGAAGGRSLPDSHEPARAAEAGCMIAQDATVILQRLGVTLPDAGDLIARTPIDGSELARLPSATSAKVTTAVAAAHKAFLAWRTVPAPRRGELVRLIG